MSINGEACRPSLLTTPPVQLPCLQNVVDGCVAGGVPALVYTSSASVVFDGHDLHKVGYSCASDLAPGQRLLCSRFAGPKRARVIVKGPDTQVHRQPCQPAGPLNWLQSTLPAGLLLLIR